MVQKGEGAVLLPVHICSSQECGCEYLTINLYCCVHMCVIQGRHISGAYASVYRHTFSAIRKFNVIENISSLRNGLH